MKSTIALLLAATAVAGFSGSALAADLYVPPPAAPVVAPAATNWDGPYIGANIGYGWANGDVTSTTPSLPGYVSTSTPTGFMVGGQIGYNFHASSNLVLGIEGAVDWSNQTGEASGLYTGITQAINWNGDIVARLGVDLGTVMPYIDAGVAFANSTRDATNANTPIPGSAVSNTQVGWTAGVGVEAMLADNLSAFVSYNYADYGNADYDTGGLYVPSVHLTNNIVKAGLNFHF